MVCIRIAKPQTCKHCRKIPPIQKSYQKKSMQKKKKKELETCFFYFYKGGKKKQAPYFISLFPSNQLHILLDLGVAPRGHGRRGLPDAAPRLQNRRMLEKLGFRKRLKTMLLQLSQMQTIIKEVEKEKRRRRKKKNKGGTKIKIKKRRRRGQECH